mmetsp:Transcript_3633/g.5585  ORF Transcript_3633/g.5585 Transcript_3633/m.5585 type:complete len:341 (-) Transcript_3633:728-1750(-)
MRFLKWAMTPTLVFTSPWEPLSISFRTSICFSLSVRSLPTLSSTFFSMPFMSAWVFCRLELRFSISFSSLAISLAFLTNSVSLLKSSSLKVWTCLRAILAWFSLVAERLFPVTLSSRWELSCFFKELIWCFKSSFWAICSLFFLVRFWILSFRAEWLVVDFWSLASFFSSSDLRFSTFSRAFSNCSLKVSARFLEFSRDSSCSFLFLLKRVFKPSICFCKGSSRVWSFLMVFSSSLFLSSKFRGCLGVASWESWEYFRNSLLNSLSDLDMSCKNLLRGGSSVSRVSGFIAITVKVFSLHSSEYFWRSFCICWANSLKPLGGLLLGSKLASFSSSLAELDM